MTTREVLVLVATVPLALLLLSLYLASVPLVRSRSATSTNLSNIAKAYCNFNRSNAARRITHGAWSVANPTAASSVAEYAAVLAYNVDLDEAWLWYIDADPANDATATFAKKVLYVPAGGPPVISPLLTEGAENGYFGYTVYAPVRTDIGGTTPLAWTRGLRRDGTWDAAKGVWGSEGGHIAFGDGHVEWHADTRDVQGGFVSLRNPGALTADWTEAVSADGDVHELKSSY